jgi:hypothetical protein
MGRKDICYKKKVGCAGVASHDFEESNSLYATVQRKKQLCVISENKGTSSLDRFTIYYL